ncbi:MAG: RluA family pseudouridine synthase, partial [Alphaproteobacteria bacterium]|nr:RluA family pseudouridine synthase [Alphaproteobacteria bacterium]
RGLSEQFAEHSIERTYFAMVYSVPNPLNGTISTNIGRSPYDRKKMAVLNNGGKSAVTNYKTIEIFSGAALVQCNLETGRTHQIRVHMASLGCNLIGDKVYEKSKKSGLRFTTDEIKQKILSFPRQALHATTLGFVHPVTNKKMSFSSEFPQDFADLLSVLRMYK